MTFRNTNALWGLLLALPLVSGCTFFAAESIEDLDEKKDYRQGQIFAQQGHIRQRFNFTYEYDYEASNYQMKLTAPFTPPLLISCSSSRLESLQLNVLGFEYRGQEAVDMLSYQIPGFPWEQIPTLLKNGDLDSESWQVVYFEKGKVEITNTQGVKIAWKEDPPSIA